jgi:hypothetical protein
MSLVLPLDDETAEVLDEHAKALGLERGQYVMLGALLLGALLDEGGPDVGAVVKCAADELSGKPGTGWQPRRSPLPKVRRGSEVVRKAATNVIAGLHEVG